MADETTTETPADETTTETPAITPAEPAVVAQEAKTVGDAELEARSVDVNVVKEEVPAQVMQPRESDSDVVNVHETYVVTDEIITDPSSPLAVQIPDAGRGSLELPIHQLDRGTVESIFAKDAAKADS